MRVIVRSVIGRRVRERLDERDARKADSDTDVRMSFGRDALNHTCNANSGG